MLILENEISSSDMVRLLLKNKNQLFGHLTEQIYHPLPKSNVMPVCGIFSILVRPFKDRSPPIPINFVVRYLKFHVLKTTDKSGKRLPMPMIFNPTIPSNHGHPLLNKFQPIKDSKSNRHFLFIESDVLFFVLIITFFTVWSIDFLLHSNSFIRPRKKNMIFLLTIFPDQSLSLLFHGFLPISHFENTLRSSWRWSHIRTWKRPIQKIVPRRFQWSLRSITSSIESLNCCTHCSGVLFRFIG